MATVAEKLLTAEEYAKMPDPGYPTELVRGEVVAMPMTGFEHGDICGAIATIFRTYALENGLGRVLTNDSGIITQRGPDTVRGADLAYYSYERVPKGVRPKGYPGVAPEIVFEVVSPSDRWKNVVVKVGEYLEAGVLLVCVVDPKTSKVHLFRSDEAAQVLGTDDEWSAPEVLGEFRVPVRRFFE